MPRKKWDYTERFITIIASMGKGDLRPLADAIKLGEPIDVTILLYLAGLIDDGSIIAKNRITVRGRPPQFDKHARDKLAVRLYQELRKTLSSEDAFRKAASAFKMTDASLRKAVTSSRSS